MIAAPLDAEFEAELVDVLGRVPAGASGALVRERDDGQIVGALLVERGRVCWAFSQRYPRRLTDVLLAEQPTLASADLDALVARCHRDRLPFGETLVSRGLVSLPVLHRALMRHTCEALDYLVRYTSAPWAWLAHAGYGYNPFLTFAPAEVLAGVRALAALRVDYLTRGRSMASTKETLNKLMEIEGVIGACIVDSNSGMMLGSAGGGSGTLSLDLELAAAGNTEVVRAKRKTMKALNLNDPIEDILITLGRQYHLLRPLSSNDALFIYVALDRSRANLALARHYLASAEKELTV